MVQPSNAAPSGAGLSVRFIRQVDAEALKEACLRRDVELMKVYLFLRGEQH